MQAYQKTIPSPVGPLTLVAQQAGLCAVLWHNDPPKRVLCPPCAWVPSHPILDATQQQLAAYFQGELQTFSVPLLFTGTAFQRQVWQALLTIPYGETRSYGDIARQIGRPLAVRAVGAANGRNPLSILAPCHRVIGSNGLLTGFAGGLAHKKWLLALEQGSAMRQTTAPNPAA